MTEISQTEKDRKARRVLTGFARMSFPYILAPRVNEENGVKTERYSLTLLFPPGGFNKAPFMSAFKAAMSQKYGADTSKWPKLKRKPDDVIQDFGVVNAEANKPLPGDWTGWTIIRAATSPKQPPQIVGPIRGADGKFPVITDQREVYGGRWARAELEAYVYDRKDGRGVTLGIVNVQLAKHDTKFGNAVTAPESSFDDDVPAEMVGQPDDFDKGAQTQGGKSTSEDEIPW